MKMINTIILLIVLSLWGKKSAGNDSEPPKEFLLSITDVQQARNNSATTNFSFIINVTNPSAKAITVQYITVDGTAKGNIG